jgi:ABC-type transporter MlaC component
MRGVRHLSRCVPAVLALLLCTPIAGSAIADTPNREVADVGQALDFVDGLATQAYLVLTDHSLDAADREARERSLVEHGFNVRYIALMALGPYAREMDDKSLGDYEAKFGDFLCRKYSALVEAYGAVRFHTLDAERAGRRDVVVHVIVDRKEGSVDTEWRVRIFDGEPRIIDVKVAGISLTQNERAEFGALIKESGLSGLMSTLSSYSVDKRV